VRGTAGNRGEDGDIGLQCPEKDILPNFFSLKICFLNFFVDKNIFLVIEITLKDIP
jgi:hypothetical protein